MICIHIFLVIFACSLDILEISGISEIGKVELKSQNIYSIFTMNNNFYVLLVILMQFKFVVVKV